MKSAVFKIFFIVSLFLSLSSCGLTSDSDTEKRIIGTWVTTYEDTEDGITSGVSAIETYNGDGTYEVIMNFQITKPERMNIGEMRYKGTWSASKTRLMCEIEKDSIWFNLSDALDSSDRSEFKAEMLSSFKESDYVEGGEIIRLTDNEFILKDEQDGSILEYHRKGNNPSSGLAAASKDHANESSNLMTQATAQKNNDDGRRAAAARNEYNTGKLPSWLASNILPTFGIRGLSMKSSEYLRDYLRSSMSNLYETNTYSGYFDEYPITMQLKIDSDGKVTGKYAYLSTLERYGDTKSSWFPLKGVVLFDEASIPYLLLESRNPSDNKVFEYALLEYSPTDKWNGRLFNVSHLTEPNMRFFSLSIDLDY